MPAGNVNFTSPANFHPETSTANGCVFVSRIQSWFRFVPNPIATIWTTHPAGCASGMPALNPVPTPTFLAAFVAQWVT
jgi:hypothetical protein